MTNDAPKEELAPRQFRSWTSEWMLFEHAARAMHPKGRSPRAKVLRDLMLWYMRRPGAKLPERPPVAYWSEPRDEEATHVSPLPPLPPAE